MKRYKKLLISGLAVLPLLTSCLKEYTPTEFATQKQVEAADKSGLSNAMAAYMNAYSTDYYYDIGFPGLGLWRDFMTADAPIHSNGYDYFSYVGSTSWLGSTYASCYVFWERYYGLVKKANLVLEAVNPENEEDHVYAGNAHAYRAHAYFEMAQWYEYRHTDIAAFDQQAASSKIEGLTVPIVTETTTEDESRHNPRAPFYKMYRFILDDLLNGEKYLEGKTVEGGKTNADIAVIYGLSARFWLYLGTRFTLHEEDLQTMLSHENDADIPFSKLGINTARDCFAKAAEYARKAINRSGAPLTETQWFDPKTGFNSVNNAWLWAVIISTNDGLATDLTWQSFPSFMSPEASYGISTPDYGGYRMIDARLFGQIPNADWRKTTWIAPEDVANEDAFNTKYARGTSLGYSDWSLFEGYTAFKFHPASGDGATSTVGNAISIPLMRVEEMYFIEAEATGRASGDAAGRQLLESFMNTYRYKDGSYVSRSAGIEGFINDLLTQKRIEFWGEGIILWDFRRLEKAITRGYPGTNWPDTYRYNSMPNAVAPWSTLCIPEAELNYNLDVLPNPDPSHASYYGLWTE